MSSTTGSADSIRIGTPESPRQLYLRLLKISVPIMLSNLLQQMYNLADAFFLGKLGREALSAPSIAMPVIFFLVVFGFGFAMAGTTLIAQSKGKGDQEKIDFYLGQTTSILILTSLLISMTGILLAVPLLNLLQVPSEVFEYTRQYMTIIFSGLPFMFMVFVLHTCMQGIGDSVTPLLVQFVTVLLNVALDPLLIFGIGPFPAMEVRGAAWATVFSRFVASFVAAAILIRGRKGLRLQIQYLKPERKALRLFIKIGLPAALGQAVTTLGFTVLQGVVNTLGTAVVAAFGVGNRIIGLFNMPAIGFSRGTAVLVGQKLGAKDKPRAKLVVRQAIITITLFITGGMTLTFFFGNHLVRFFVDDPEVIELGIELFRIVSVSVIFFVVFTVVMGVFQGGGDTKPIMYLNAARLWVLRVPLAFLFVRVFFWGPKGIWIAMFISNFIISIAGFILLKSGRWMHKLNPDDI